MSRSSDARVVVVGGGPAGSTAAECLAREGVSVLLIDPERSRPKPCAGAVPPLLLEEFRIPPDLVVYQSRAIDFVAPSRRTIRVDSEVGPVSSICRESFDPYLRRRASEAGASIVQGRCLDVSRSRNSYDVVVETGRGRQTLQAEIVLAADGAKSSVARSLRFPPPRRMFAYQERIVPPEGKTDLLNVPYVIDLDGRYSPDRYAWVFPKGNHLAVGSVWRGGVKPVRLIDSLKSEMGLGGWHTSLREGCPVAYGLAPRLVQGRVLLLGDAGGLAAPATGEGIYYAMKSGALAAETVLECAETDRFRRYTARIRDHFGRLYKVLSVLERLFLCSQSQRERLVRLFQQDCIREIAIKEYMNKGFLCVGWGRIALSLARHSWQILTG